MKPKKRKARDIRPGHGYAWAIDFEDGRGFGLCHWAEPSRAALGRCKPSPEAIIVPVDILPCRKKARGR